jgi:cysteine desulfurase
VDAGCVKKCLRKDTVLISIMHANNETGSIQPVEEISRLASERKVLFHTDAVQSAGKLLLDVTKVPADLVSISGHKLYGPKGTGALYVRTGTKMVSLFHGGGQERYRRPGTENVAGIIGLARACELAMKERKERERKVRSMRDLLLNELKRRIPDLIVNGPLERTVYNTLNISIPGTRSQDLLIGLDLKGICASAGSACHAGLPEPSHVLKAMGVPEDLISATIRFSLGIFNTRAEVLLLARVLPGIVKRSRSHGRRRGCGNETDQN